jgi:hypothetical protein
VSEISNTDRKFFDIFKFFQDYPTSEKLLAKDKILELMSQNIKGSEIIPSVEKYLETFRLPRDKSL